MVAEDVDRVGLGLGEQGHEEVGPGDLALACALDVEHGALKHPAHADGLVTRELVVVGHPVHRLVEKVLQLLADGLDVTSAALDDLRGAAVVEQRQQQVLEGEVLVTPVLGVFDRSVDRGFQFVAEHVTSLARYSFRSSSSSGSIEAMRG